MPRCDECNRNFASDAALAQHNSDKHGSVSKHDMKQMKKQEREMKQRTEQDKVSRKKKIRTITIIAVVALAVIALGAFVIYLPKPEPTGSPGRIGPVGSTHQHADFKVYILGEQLDFTSPRYQVRAREVHIEGGDDDVIHKHATGVTVGHFFRTLGFAINFTCIRTDSNEQYCSNEDATLKYLLKKDGMEWEQVNSLSDYEIRDLDKYLITYGNETDVSGQQNSVTDKARIESGRGREMPL